MPGDWTWSRPGSRARSPEPHQVGGSREGSERRCRPAAGCPPLSRTMSDGEGPSAGEWQCYIYPLQVPLQSQGHWSPRAPPPPPRPGLQAAVGLDPLPPSPIPGGPALQEGRLSKLTRSAACPWLPDVAGAGSCSCRKPLPLSAGASRAGPQFSFVTRPPGGLRVTRAPGTACKKMCESICLRDEEPTASIGFPQGLRPVGSPESLSASTRQALRGPPNPPGWKWPKTQAGGGTLDPGVGPHALCPAPGRGHCGAWLPAGRPVWAETGFGMSP